MLDVLTSVQFDITYEVNYDSTVDGPDRKTTTVLYNRGTSAIQRDILNF